MGFGSSLDVETDRECQGGQHDPGTADQREPEPGGVRPRLGDDGTHVVTAAKERAVLRPHGHIMRTAERSETGVGLANLTYPAFTQTAITFTPSRVGTKPRPSPAVGAEGRMKQPPSTSTAHPMIPRQANSVPSAT